MIHEEILATGKLYIMWVTRRWFLIPLLNSTRAHTSSHLKTNNMVNKPKRFNKLLTILAAFVTLFTLGNCSSCEIPDEWSSGNVGIQVVARDYGQSETYTVQNVSSRWSTWPYGVVKYKLHSSLTLKDTSEVLEAFDEFHKRTCIQFKPWEEEDTDFVSIEVDDNVCGFANVCKIGGPQVAKFGKNCRNFKTMIHQLGHTLCLGHEHQRPDRDSYLNFSNCSNNPNKTTPFRQPMGMYDYNSQMHSQCNSCEGGFPRNEIVKHCGPDATPGLSVLDVENINYLYNCEGCRRHRWVPAASLSHEDFSKMPTFGFETEEKEPIYACRAYYRAEFIPGMYDHARKSCRISWGYMPHEVTEVVEVLTIPGGVVGEDCSIYNLVNWRNALEQDQNLVYVGDILYQPYWNWTSHIAYSTVDGKKVVGKTWLRNGIRFNSDAEINMGTTSSRPGEYQVLTCQLDKTCMLKKIFASRKCYDQQNHISA